MSLKTLIFNYTGSNQTFKVPPFVNSVSVKLWGAGGGNGEGYPIGDPGGYTSGSLSVIPGQVLSIMVGQGGLGSITIPSYQESIDTYKVKFTEPSCGGSSGVSIDTSPQLLIACGGSGGQSNTDSSYVAPKVIAGFTLYNNSPAYGNSIKLPPSTTDPDYIDGVGLGATTSNGNGNNGLVVISYDQPQIIMNQTVDKDYSDLNNPLTYTVTLTNRGVVTLTNVVFVSTIVSQVAFIPNSLRINGITTPGTIYPPGTIIPQIQPGETVTIRFSVNVSTIPSANNITNISTSSYEGGFVFNSNQVSTTINDIILSENKFVDKNFAQIGDIITYTIPIKNSGNTTATNVYFLDTIPDGLSLVQNSFIQDGSIIFGIPNLILPYNIGPGATSTVSYKVIVNSIPNPNPIQSSASISAIYSINPYFPNPSSKSAHTNLVNTKINNANLSNITTSVNKEFAKCNDIIMYTIVIPNSGSTTAINVVLIDTIPNGATFVPNSVTVNERVILGANPSLGINIPDIGPLNAATITFKVQV